MSSPPPHPTPPTNNLIICNRFTDCEVYLTIGGSTDLPRDYYDYTGGEVVEIDHPVVSVLHPSASNYYHFTAEVGCLNGSE